MSTVFVAILMGSDSDFAIMQYTVAGLKKLNLAYEVKITSAHRTPDATRAYIEDAASRGCEVFIAAAGLSAHLAGAVAAHTLKPVIGVPLDAGGLGGMDALLATAQMPGGVPVACVAIGKAGAQNAAYLAAQMLALQDKSLYECLVKERAARAQQVQEKNKALQAQLMTNS